MMPFFVERVGALTAAGQSVEETVANIAAGMCRYRGSPYASLTGAPYVVAPVLELTPALRGAERGMLLLEPAIDECVDGAGPELGRLAVLLSVDPAPSPIPDPRHAAIARAAEKAALHWAPLPAALKRTLDARGLSAAGLEVIPATAGWPLPLERAAALLEGGVADRVLLCAVSSACEPARLDWLALLDRLSPPPLQRPLVGGEAGVALLLGREPSPVAIGAVACQREAADETASRRAEPLTEVVRQAVELGGVAGKPAVWIDLPDGRHLAKEWLFASTRIFGARKLIPDMVYPAHILGHLGAATLPLYVALASRANRLPSLVVSMSDGPRRTAISVTANDG